MMRYWRIFPGSASDEHRDYSDSWISESCIGIDFDIGIDLLQYDKNLLSVKVNKELEKKIKDRSVKYFKEMAKGDIVVMWFGEGIKAIGELPTDFDNGYYFNPCMRSNLRQRHLRYIKWLVVFPCRPYYVKEDAVREKIKGKEENTIREIKDDNAIKLIKSLIP